ncbi:MAG TPA: GNAT family N-acetyltransferase [Stellaceae bacterium]|nr:GNAT family N-acetyltransferase [Stellaceae bacterium]
MAPAIRPALLGDVDAIAAAHVAAWREAYRGLLPDSVLADLSVPGRAQQWRQTLTRGISVVFVADGREGEVVGFVSGGPRRSGGLRGEAEIYALYVRAELQRQGLGRSLMRAAAAALAARGFASLGLWVLRGNAAGRAFYQHIGGTLGGERQDKEAGHVIDEVAYEWPDLSALVGESR